MPRHRPLQSFIHMLCSTARDLFAFQSELESEYVCSRPGLWSSTQMLSQTSRTLFDNVGHLFVWCCAAVIIMTARLCFRHDIRHNGQDMPFPDGRSECEAPSSRKFAGKRKEKHVETRETAPKHRRFRDLWHSLAFPASKCEENPGGNHSGLHIVPKDAGEKADAHFGCSQLLWQPIHSMKSAGATRGQHCH